MKNLNETNFIAGLIDGFSTSPIQVNKPFESDAEIIQFGKTTLAITTDSIVEEIESGLYDDPFLIGWMTVIINLSDLAAVGAEPVKLLLNETIPSNYPDEHLKSIQSGINAACLHHHTYILGGDTNFGKTLQTTATAIGKISESSPIGRKGAGENHLLYASGPLGKGNAYAFQKLGKTSGSSIQYKPVARLKEGEIVREFGSACIDTSDGFFPALATLLEINQKGVHITTDFEQFSDPISCQFFKELNLPIWFLLAGPHGEFELLFTIPPENHDNFIAAANTIEWKPLHIGNVNFNTGFYYLDNNLINPFEVANLFGECEGSIDIYLERLLSMNHLWTPST